jgi:hypothetical protein
VVVALRQPLAKPVAMLQEVMEYVETKQTAFNGGFIPVS